jgi:drug/metabolite transporter (DMT)-like permease
MDKLRGYWRYWIAVIVIIAAVLGVAWFYDGGQHFKSVAGVCYGYLIGYVSGFLTKSFKDKRDKI